MARRILVQSTLVWCAGRAMVVAMGAVMGLAPEDTVLFASPRAVLLAIAAVAVICSLRWRHRGEHVLLANLGVAEGWLVALALVPPIAGEVALAIGGEALLATVRRLAG